MTPLRRTLLALAAVVVVLAVLVMRGFASAPLPEPAPLVEPLPSASPPKGMQVFGLVTGVIHRNAAVAYRGGAFGDKRDFVAAAVLVKHPRGDLLVDAGFSRDVDAHFRLMPAFMRLVTRYERGVWVSEQLDRAGYDRKRLRGIVLTHAHWDHASGLADFPRARVLVTPEERAFVAGGDALTAVARTADNVVWEEIRFDGGPYLGFPRSWDVYGDGAIVVVPAPGHTPGSVIVFLALPGGVRYALVGDLVWQQEGIYEREERPFVSRWVADADEALVREQISRMAAVVARFPDMRLVPAHDARGYEGMDTLVPAR